MLTLLQLIQPAMAAPDSALSLSAGTGSVGQHTVIGGRLGWKSGFQLGLRAEGSRARGWYIDGREVRNGLAFGGVVTGTVPIVKLEALRVDLEIDLGLRQLAASDTDAMSPSALVLLADVSPMATLPVTRDLGIRLGFKQITHQQLRPTVDAEAQGTLLRSAALVIPNDDLQVGFEGLAGSAFGFDGDGGKAIVHGGAFVRWVPGAARTFTNH